jgi:hypothetical protein
MNREMNMVQRHRDGVVRQAQVIQPQARRKSPRKRLLAGILIVALCSTIATATLVNYLSQTATTNVTVTSPITLSDDWEDLQATGGSNFDLSTYASNAANQDILGIADIWIMVSTDGGNTWSPYNFVDGDGGITVTCTAPISDAGLLVNSNYDIRFPATTSFTFPTGGDATRILLTFHVEFADGLTPAMYRFSLVIRPTSYIWS